MNSEHLSFWVGLLVFGSDGALLIAAGAMLMRARSLAPDVQNGKGLKLVLLPLLAVAKTFFLVGASYLAISVFNLPAPAFVCGALVSLMLLIGATLALYHKGNNKAEQRLKFHKHQG